MWGIISTAFLIIYCIMGYYIGRRGWTTIGRSSSNLVRRLYWVIFALLLLSFPIARFGEDLLPTAESMWLTLWGWYSMLAVVYICLFLLAVDVLSLVDRRIPFLPVQIKEHQKAPLIIMLLIITSVVLTLGYGQWNAKNPVITNYELLVNKKAGSLDELKIAMVSDLHYGEIIDAKRIKRMVNTINETQPDLVLISGDIVEGNANTEEAKKLTDALKGIRAKFGTFAVPGNHDRWVRNDTSNLMTLFQEAGVKVLLHESLIIANSFYLVGRDDQVKSFQAI